MNEDFIARISRIEDGFGLSESTPLSPDMHPMKLLDRLETVIHSIKTYEIHKKEREKNQDSKH